jgi:uncharacterized protein (UPF0276 family)
MMKFALNYSPQAVELLQAGAIDIDLFKCPNWEDLVPLAEKHRPVYIHFPFEAGTRPVEEIQMEIVQSWLDRTPTPYVNTHITPIYDNLDDPNDRDEVVSLVLAGVMPLVERFGAEKVIAENIPYPERKISNKPLLSADPQVITRVIEESGCGLLLDIGHARRTAEHLAVDPRLYIEELPVHRLREVHITGLGYHPDEGRRVDHLPMMDEDWLLLEWALEHIRRGDWSEPWVVSCEYGGIGAGFEWRSDIKVIAEQIPRMYAMIKAAQPESV